MMNHSSALSLLLIFAVASKGYAFIAPAPSRSLSLASMPTSSHTHVVLSMSIIDDLKLLFSEEGKANKAAYEARERADQEAAQREILERRRNPEKMEDYEQKVNTSRAKLQEEKDVWGFQGKIEEGFDPLTEWTRLKDEGLITVGSEMERDPSSSRLGSEGLVDIRTDELLPYIDQGYVDESADIMGGFMNIFGGKKEDNKNENKEDAN